jgi:starch synthase
MIQVLHISAECYPAAKTGGLGDVVGSLPKYLSTEGTLSGAVIPKYDLKWIRNAEWTTVFQGTYWMDWRQVAFRVQQFSGPSLGYALFVVDIPGIFDRPGIYNDPAGHAYGDEIQRTVGFQQAVLEWLLSFPWYERPRVLHCHDHHTGLIPWMVKHCPTFQQLAPIPTVFTIHNGQYQGAFSIKNSNLLPPYDANSRWLIEWNGTINPMASAIKCAWAVSTVSQSYLYELHESSMGMESLLQQEWRKEYGIVNGIDAQVWDPATDPMLQHRLDTDGIQAFKYKNKKELCTWFGFPEDQPLISFIGRIVGEKGADLLPDAYRRFITGGGKASFLVLGTGETWTQNEFRRMAYEFPGRFNAVIDYNEALAHQIYAGSDFLIMPSRVEPCGLNQMYAMRYGTIPIVRSVGGLKDTVPDISMPDGSGRGIRFDHFNVEDAYNAIYRAVSMYQNEPGIVQWLQNKIMAVDFSWEHAVAQYLQIYRNIGAQVGPAQSQPDSPAVTIEHPPILETKVDLPKKAKTTKAKDVPAETEPVQPAPEAIKTTVPKTASKTSKTAAKPKDLEAKKEDKAPKPPKTTKPK